MQAPLCDNSVISAYTVIDIYHPFTCMYVICSYGCTQDFILWTACRYDEDKFYQKFKAIDFEYFWFDNFLPIYTTLTSDPTYKYVKS